MPLTTQHTTNTRDEHPCRQRDSNLHPQQSSGRRSMPYSARPLESSVFSFTIMNQCPCNLRNLFVFIPESDRYRHFSVYCQDTKWYCIFLPVFWCLWVRQNIDNSRNSDVSKSCKCPKVQIFGNIADKPKLYSRRRKVRLNSGYAYRSFQDLFSSRKLSEELKIKVYNICNVTFWFVCAQKLICHRKWRM